MTRVTGVLVAAALAACSDFTTTDGGIARLDVYAPIPAEVEVGQTIQLRAVARDENGDSLDIPVFWRALDTTIAVDSTLGRITGLTAGLSGRVVARAVDLYSNVISFDVLRLADTLIRASDSAVTVASSDSASPELVVRVEGGEPPAPIQGRRLTYQVIAPVFASPDDRTVEFSGGTLAISPRSSALGTPDQPVTLRRRSDRQQPDTAVVQVSVYRPDGTVLPGSGLRFYVLFLN